MKEGKTCKICSKTFTRRNYLQKHMANIHSKRYSCPICLRYFAAPTEHSCATKDGRFTCYVEKCSLKFANGMSLRLHIRDGHRKVDENLASGEALKTKKAAKDMVKMLCKKINVLSKCFDELKYQLDNVTDFLKTIGYEKPSSIAAIDRQDAAAAFEQNYETDVDGLFEEYIEEELIEEVTDDEMIASGTKQKNSTETERNQTITSFPKKTPHATSATTKAPVNSIRENKSTPTLMINNSPLTVINLPPVARVGNTIISQVPIKFLPMHGQLTKPIIVQSATTKSQTEATNSEAKAEKDTPSLFLNIQYDTETATETAVCKADPKIIFHFDTKPLDNAKKAHNAPT